MNGNLGSPPSKLYLGQESPFVGPSQSSPLFVPSSSSPARHPQSNGHHHNPPHAHHVPRSSSASPHYHSRHHHHHGAKSAPRVWHPLRPGRYDLKEEEWKEVNSISAKDMNVQKRTLTIVTYNVLFDLYKPELLFTDVRVPAICELLRSADADIIGLEEVTQPFLLYLLSQDWVKESYYVSDWGSGETVHPYGQVILSRFPFYNLVAHQFSLYKMFVVGEFMINGRKVCVPVVHLTSDRAKDCSQHRASQLQIIYDRLDKDSGSSTDCFMLGDFNMNVGETVRNDFQDAWELLRPNEEGNTFDVNINATAALMARDDDDPSASSTTSQRFDRVLLRSDGGYWKPHSIEMFGTEPIVWQHGGEGMHTTFPSDHFGLRCVLEFLDEGDRQAHAKSLSAVSSFHSSQQPLIQIQPPLAIQSKPYAPPARSGSSPPHAIHGHIYVPHTQHSHSPIAPAAHASPQPPHLSHQMHYRPRAHNHNHNNHSHSHNNYKSYSQPQSQPHSPSGYAHGPSTSHPSGHYPPRSRQRYYN